jgi:hypothetical protein
VCVFGLSGQAPLYKPAPGGAGGVGAAPSPYASYAGAQAVAGQYPGMSASSAGVYGTEEAGGAKLEGGKMEGAGVSVDLRPPRTIHFSNRLISSRAVGGNK